MRIPFEDQTFAEPFAGAEVYQVGLPETARRDLWFRLFTPDGSALELRAYATRDEAKTDPAPAGYLARAVFAVGAGPQSLTLTDNGATSPDMTGLIVQGRFSAVPDRDDINALDLGVVWAYIAHPEVITADNIRTRVLTQAGAGLAFEGITAANIRIGDDAGGMEVLSPVGLVIYPGPLVEAESGGVGQLAARTCTIAIAVGCEGGSSGEGLWQKGRVYMDALASLLGDEHRLSYGEVLQMTAEVADGPATYKGDTTIVEGLVKVTADYHAFFRDDRFPRD